MKDLYDVENGLTGFRILQNAEEKSEVMITLIKNYKKKLLDKNVSESLNAVIGIEVLSEYVSHGFLTDLERERNAVSFLFEALEQENE